MLTSSVLISGVVSMASGSEQNNVIPTRMQAGTIIEYDNSKQLVIIEPGTPLAAATNSQKQVKKILSIEEQIKLDKENQLVNRIKTEAMALPVYKIENPAPEAGLRVVYDGDGLIKEFIYPTGGGFTPFAYTPLPRGSRKPAGTYTYGASNNTITITGSSTGQVLGVGRFTNFTDTTGENSNTLKRETVQP